MLKINTNKKVIVFIEDKGKDAKERFVAYEREKFMISFFSSNHQIGSFKTLEEGEEWVLSRGGSVVYEGVFENGKRKGMTGWRTEEAKAPVAIPEYVAPPSTEVEWKHTQLRKSGEFKRKSIG